MEKVFFGPTLGGGGIKSSTRSMLLAHVLVILVRGCNVKGEVVWPWRYMRNVGKASQIINLCTKLKWVGSFTARPLSAGNSPRCPVIGGSGSLQSGCPRGWAKRNLLPRSGIKPRFLSCRAHMYGVIFRTRKITTHNPSFWTVASPAALVVQALILSNKR